MKYLLSIAERIGALIIGIIGLLAGILGSFHIFGRVLCIVGGLVIVIGVIWIFVTKKDIKEIDKDEQEFQERRIIEISQHEDVAKAIQAETLPYSKTVEFSLGVLGLGKTKLQLWVNDNRIGELSKENKKIQFSTNTVQNYLYISWLDDQDNQNKSKYCFFEVVSPESVGNIAFFGSDAFNVYDKNGIVSWNGS